MDDTPSPASDDAQRWLAAAAARIEDDPDLMDGISPDSVESLLAAERTSSTGVAAGIRRRVRETGAKPAPRWRWPAAVGALALTTALAVAVLRPTSPDPAETVLAYQAELAAYAGPQIKGEPSPTDPARLLLAAARATPPDTALARRAARGFDERPEPNAAFFAGLGYRLAGADADADAAFARVPESSPFADVARQLR